MACEAEYGTYEKFQSFALKSDNLITKGNQNIEYCFPAVTAINTLKGKHPLKP